MEQDEVQNGCDDENLGILTKKMVKFDRNYLEWFLKEDVSTAMKDERRPEISSSNIIKGKVLENDIGSTYPEDSLCQPRIDASLGQNLTDSHLEGKPPRRDSNLRPLACGNNLPKNTLGGQLR
ncbi:hypothetical protein Tco_1212276 [Tanacetum coccineum]